MTVWYTHKSTFRDSIHLRDDKPWITDILQYVSAVHEIELVTPKVDPCTRQIDIP